MNQALHHALFGFSCWMHSVGLRAYHCAALEYQGRLEVSAEHEKNFRGRPNSKKEIRAHDDRPLSGIKGVNYREEKDKTKERQGLGHFTMASSLPLSGVRYRFLCGCPILGL